MNEGKITKKRHAGPPVGNRLVIQISLEWRPSRHLHLCSRDPNIFTSFLETEIHLSDTFGINASPFAPIPRRRDTFVQTAFWNLLDEHPAPCGHPSAGTAVAVNFDHVP